MSFFIIYFFADAGYGDGGWDHLGPFWIHYKVVLTPFWIHCMTVLGPSMPPEYVFQQKDFLGIEMAHTNFVSSIR